LEYLLYLEKGREISLKGKSSKGGLILICIGVFWLLSSFGVINWSLFDVMFKLWPLMLIVIGINMIFRSKNYIKYITWGIFIVTVILFGFYGEYGYKNDASFNIDSNFVQENIPETTAGKLRLQLGGGNLRINPIDDKLIIAKVPDSKVKKDIKFIGSDKSKVNINIEQKTDIINLNKKKTYDYGFDLNSNVVWDIDIDTGAINGTLDFSDLKVSKLDIDMGVSNLKLIFGDNQSNTKVDIDGGISNLDMTIPENVGVRVDFDGGIKNTNIGGLGWRKTGDYYVSPNYDEAEKKLELDVDIGIGKFYVKIK
jgi:hypothetical protein